MVKKNPQYEMQRRQHKHEMKMALIKAMGDDPELKYFIGVAGGAATGLLGELLNSNLGGLTGSSSTTEPEETSSNLPWMWILSGASPYTLPLAVAENMSSTMETDVKTNGILGMLPMVGAGFAGFCALVLILKAIFGDEDVASLASAMGSLMPGMVPIP